MNEIKIPCVALGTKTEELIRDAIEVKRENNAIKRRFIRQIFSDASQLERGTNQFNTSLYKSILEYGASEHFFKPWTPSTEVLLEIFNRAYKIATIAINMEVPLDRYADFWDMATIWEELDPETAAWVGESHQRNLPVLYATFAMVHAIVDREKDKSEFIEDFLDTMRTDEDVNEAMDFFPPADKQGVVTLKNDSVSSAPEHSNYTPAPTPQREENELKEKEDKIKIAINNWLAQKKRDKNQWFVVYKLLLSRNLTSKYMKVFCEQMSEMGFKDVTYDSVAKSIGRELPEALSEWPSRKYKESGVKLKMIQAFEDFKKCLKEQGF